MTKRNKDTNWSTGSRRPSGGATRPEGGLPFLNKEDRARLAAVQAAERDRMRRDRAPEPTEQHVSAACQRKKCYRCFSRKCACDCGHQQSK